MPTAAEWLTAEESARPPDLGRPGELVPGGVRGGDDPSSTAGTEVPPEVALSAAEEWGGPQQGPGDRLPVTSLFE